MSIVLLFLPGLLWVPAAPGPRIAAADRRRARHELVLPEPYLDSDDDIILDWSQCDITAISGTMFAQWPDLTQLILESNQIETIPAYAFRCLKDLKYLDLKENRIQTVHEDAFIGLENLVDLDLKQNLIQTIHFGTFRELDYLVKLDLQQNWIQTIQSRAFFGLDSVDELDLGDNLIETIDDGAFDDLVSLKELSLDNNGICNNWIDPAGPSGELRRAWGLPDTTIITCAIPPVQ
ncbi:unnamed protein product (mitochondrion) [Plasmodiophora brassicae]|uniref:Leucine-rich repeat-containing N-terminal plant-type domain-containing protein n=1 Tax=Plasmodiophora brassicae TaxID=37360 RepID=A0A0G4J8D8_PLABS|nr:hypothetical protein PBRA_003495 [Plasmodiophora brassicae]SPQ99847.1 unnamed protein product [Plasmodiophora brassicae]